MGNSEKNWEDLPADSDSLHDRPQTCAMGSKIIVYGYVRMTPPKTRRLLVRISSR